MFRILQISQAVGYLLGYDTFDDSPSDIYYVNGRELNGNSGYAKIYFKDSQIVDTEFFD